MRLKNSYRLGAPGVNITSRVSGTREQMALYQGLMRTGQYSPRGAVDFIKTNALDDKAFKSALRKNTTLGVGSLTVMAGAMGASKVIPLQGLEATVFPKVSGAIGTAAAKTGIAKLAAYKVAAAAMTGWGGVALGVAAIVGAGIYLAKAISLKIERVKMSEEERAKIA